MNIAIIPARGGSKRIPGKNVKDFVGKPLISYSIEAALNSGVFDRVVVTTDSKRIADISLAHGASDIVFRPEELSNDHVGTFPVVQHAIHESEARLGNIENVCCIYATAPFLTGTLLAESYHRLKSNTQAQYVFSVTTFPFPIQRAIRRKEEGVEPISPEYVLTRSQDLEECYHDAGQFYWGRRDAWLDGLGIFSIHSSPFILPRHLVQDIDTPEDWERAELMYKAYIQEDTND